MKSTKPFISFTFLFLSFWIQAQQGTIIFHNTNTDGTNSIGPHDSNKSLRINGEKNVDIIIDEQSQYADGAFNVFRDGPSVNPLFQVTRDGNVGIGKASTSKKLDVNGTIGAQDILVVQKGSSYKVALNGQVHGYVTGRNSAFENKFLITSNGNTYFNGGKVGIGTTTPDAQLAVNGDIHAEEVKVDLNVPGPDYVFKEGYDLKTLEEVQNHIEAKGHLPNIPSAAEMEADGIELGEMNMKLLEKIEELTLYLIQIKKTNQKQQEQLIKMNKELTFLKQHIENE